MNDATLIGHLADDPKISATAAGVKKCTFRVATQRKYTNQQTGKREADFHTVVAWRELAEQCGRYLTKGRLCSVKGSIQYRSYDAQDGSKRYVTEIVADSVEFLGGRPQSGGNTQGSFTEVNDELPF